MLDCDKKYKPNTFFAPQIASGYGVYHSNRNKTRTLTRQLLVRLCAYVVSVFQVVDSEPIRFFINNSSLSAGKWTRWFRAQTTFACSDPSSVPRTCFRWLTVTRNSSSRGADPLSRPSQAPAFNAHTCGVFLPLIGGSVGEGGGRLSHDEFPRRQTLVMIQIWFNVYVHCYISIHHPIS